MSRFRVSDEWIAGIRDALPAVKSICHNINVKQTNVIFGDETRVLWGSEVIYDYIGDVKFAISARSFFQVNPVQTEVLYGKALEYAGADRRRDGRRCLLRHRHDLPVPGAARGTGVRR